MSGAGGILPTPGPTGGNPFTGNGPTGNPGGGILPTPGPTGGTNNGPFIPPVPAQAPPAGAGGKAAAPAPAAPAPGGFVSYVENPPFDPRIRLIPGVASSDTGSEGGSTLFRGRIETRDKVNGYFRRLNFLYNPSGVQWTGSVDTNTIGDAAVMDPNDSSQFIMPMSQSVGFSLMFDRTYETWVYDANIETSRLGVVADIKHFYAMLGILGDPTAYLPANVHTQGDPASWGTALVASLKNSVDVSTIDDASPTSFMQYVQVRVILGKHVSYYGVINSATVSYTHFTQRMIPNRCSLEISMTLFPVTNLVVNGGQNIQGPGTITTGAAVAPGQPGNMGISGR
jgi:hypothetical protein